MRNRLRSRLRFGLRIRLRLGLRSNPTLGLRNEGGNVVSDARSDDASVSANDEPKVRSRPEMRPRSWLPAKLQTKSVARSQRSSQLRVASLQFAVTDQASSANDQARLRCERPAEESGPVIQCSSARRRPSANPCRFVVVLAGPWRSWRPWRFIDARAYRNTALRTFVVSASLCGGFPFRPGVGY